MMIVFERGKKLWLRDVPCDSTLGWVSEMEEYLGTQVTIDRKFDPTGFLPYATSEDEAYFIKEDNGRYVWDKNMFCEENPNVVVEGERASLDEFLGEFKLV